MLIFRGAGLPVGWLIGGGEAKMGEGRILAFLSRNMMSWGCEYVYLYIRVSYPSLQDIAKFAKECHTISTYETKRNEPLQLQNDFPHRAPRHRLRPPSFHPRCPHRGSFPAPKRPLAVVDRRPGPIRMPTARRREVLLLVERKARRRHGRWNRLGCRAEVSPLPTYLHQIHTYNLHIPNHPSIPSHTY